MSMIQLVKDIRQDWFCRTSFIFSLIYIICLLPIYQYNYFVPDMKLYSSFANVGYAAKDGFSSLFIVICGLINLWPIGLHTICLLGLSSSMFFITYFYRKIFSIRNFSVDLLVILVVYSCSIWYYIYGKLFYDFPLTAINLSAILYLVIKIQRCETEKIKNRECYILWLLFGLLISWKAYNIFIFVGFILLILCKNKNRKIYGIFFSKIQCLYYGIFLILGYIVGNFNLLFRPSETIGGIRAYQASYNFYEFLFGKNRIIWDHVNALPFQLSSMLVSTAIVILFILPIIIKKYEYLAVSIFMTICFYIFITYYSPGYPWHGFTFSIFILLYFIFIISEFSSISIRKNISIGILYMYVGLQAISCFTFYIPKQLNWLKCTKESIDICEKYESDIRNDVTIMIENYGDNYCIDMAVKRLAIAPLGPLHLQNRNLKNIYLYADNYVFSDCLKNNNRDVWDELYKKGKAYTYMQVVESADYVIYILPKNFKKISEVANVFKYESYEVVERLDRQEYSVIVYKII